MIEKRKKHTTDLLIIMKNQIHITVILTLTYSTRVYGFKIHLN